MFGGNSTLAEDFFLYVSRRICRTKQKGRLLSRPFVDHLLAPQALTIGPLETGPLVPPPPPLFGPPFGGLRLRGGRFSGFGVTGPSTYSKPILSLAVASSLTSTTRTCPPPLSWPNS